MRCSCSNVVRFCVAGVLSSQLFSAKNALFVLGFIVASRVAPVSGTQLYSNLNGSISGSDHVSSFGPLADSFSTGSSAASLTDVEVALSGSSTSGTITVELLSDNSTSPGNLIDVIGTMSDGKLTAAAQDFNFPISTAIPLAANSRYWIELASSNATAATWDYSTDLSGVGVANEFYANIRGVHANSAGGPYLLGVNPTAVPEPASILLLAIGFAASAIWLRQQNRSGATQCVVSTDFRNQC